VDVARPKEFDKDAAVRAAITVFAEYGFEGTSTEVLVRSMGIGRQSLYDTFGDKWQLYLEALRLYTLDQVHEQIVALRRAPRAIAGIVALVNMVIADVDRGCLGVGSIWEFGCSKPEVVVLNEAAGRALRDALTSRIREAQADGDVAAELDANQVSAFLVMTFAGIKIAGRAGASTKELRAMAQLAMRSLR
jgi:AcrR family transcriptional regulator